MADLSITPANLHPSPGAVPNSRVAAVAITAGQVLCMNSDGTVGLADANGTAPADVPIGIAICSAPGIGQYVLYVTQDSDFTLGATTASGVIYVLSGTPGGIIPADEMVAGMKTSIVGVGKTGNKLWLQLIASGQTV